MTWSFVKRTAMQDSAIHNICWKNIYSVTLASFLFTDEKIFTVSASKKVQNDWQNASVATKKKDDATERLHKINVQSLTASVGELQVVDSTSFDTCRSRS